MNTDVMSRVRQLMSDTAPLTAANVRGVSLDADRRYCAAADLADGTTVIAEIYCQTLPVDGVVRDGRTWPTVLTTVHETDGALIVEANITLDDEPASFVWAAHAQ